MSGRDLDQVPAAAALRHPTRIRILEVVNERDMSPVKFLQLGFVQEGGQAALSHVSYHFRKLKEDGCLEIVGRKRRRGAVEHVYRGRARTEFSDEQWEELPSPERLAISRAIYQGLAARADGAMLAGTFDSKPDRHLTWIGFDVDQRGWLEAMTSLLECFHTMKQIRREAEQRLSASGETATPMTVGILGFESSPAGALTLKAGGRS